MQNSECVEIRRQKGFLMGRVFTIARREMSSLFYSPIAYVVLFLFLLFMGIFFALWIFLPGQVTELRNLVNLSRFALFFIVPLMTMSIFADEYKSGRIEMLRTSPIREIDLVLGKFLGAMGFYTVLVLTTLIYLLLLVIFGRPDWGQVFASYIGMMLMGCMYVSVGVFFSACTKEQIVAALAGVLTLGAFTLISLPLFTDNMPSNFKLFGATVPVRAVAVYLGVGTHIADFSKGVVETSHVAYFVGISAFFLFLTYLLLESRKWR
jgi:ABC-2 type transport system permease protein